MTTAGAAGPQHRAACLAQTWPPYLMLAFCTSLEKQQAGPCFRPFQPACLRPACFAHRPLLASTAAAGWASFAPPTPPPPAAPWLPSVWRHSRDIQSSDSLPLPSTLQIVLGFIYAILASAACSLFAGCLVYVRSSHDEVRASAAALLLEAGRRISL